MPFTDIASYPPTAREFDGHWVQVNAFLTGVPLAPLILPGPFTQTDYNALIDTAESVINAVSQMQTEVDEAANTIKLSKGPVMERFKQLRKAFDAFLAGTKYAKTLPVTPRSGTAGPDWVKPLEQALKLWADVNADASLTAITRPLTLAGGYTQAQFSTDALALRDAIKLRAAIPTTLEPMQNDRDSLMRQLKDRAVAYRAAVESQLEPTNPLYLSLPAANAAREIDPNAVKVRLVEDPPSGVKKLAWTAASVEVDRLSVKISSGPRYKEADSRSVADLSNTTVEWPIPADLLAPGSTNWFKVVSHSATDNVASSNTVKVMG